MGFVIILGGWIGKGGGGIIRALVRRLGRKPSRSDEGEGENEKVWLERLSIPRYE